jgi:hypothetical protein
MSSVVLSPGRFEAGASSSNALRFAERFWFVASVIGQWIFLYYIVRVYGPSSMTGDFARWSRNTFLIKGYVRGDTAGNLSFAAHALLAGVTSFGGALQLVPRIRQRAMAFHRWNGRVFLVTTLAVSVTGIYMVWVRGAKFGNIMGSAVTLNGLLIIWFAIVAWREALARNVAAHRVAALRLYLVANGQWFVRVGVFAFIAIRGAFGITKGGMGPFILFWSFGCYAVPLLVLELWMRAWKAGSRARFAMAGALFALTLLMCVGIFGVTMYAWRPVIGRL